MNIKLIIQVIGIVCWIFHQAHHTKVCDATYPATDEAAERHVEKWMCRKCDKSWEVPA